MLYCNTNGWGSGQVSCLSLSLAIWMISMHINRETQTFAFVWAHLNTCICTCVYSLWPFVFLHWLWVAVLFLHADVSLGCWTAEVNVGKQCFYTLSETGTRKNDIFPSVTLGLAVAVSGRESSLAALGDDGGSGSETVSPSLDQCKRDLVCGLEALYLKLLFYKVCSDWGRKRKDVRGDHKDPAD